MPQPTSGAIPPTGAAAGPAIQITNTSRGRNRDILALKETIGDMGGCREFSWGSASYMLQEQVGISLVTCTCNLHFPSFLLHGRWIRFGVCEVADGGGTNDRDGDDRGDQADRQSPAWRQAVCGGDVSE